jgi:hypothetical protein
MRILAVLLVLVAICGLGCEKSIREARAPAGAIPGRGELSGAASPSVRPIQALIRQV